MSKTRVKNVTLISIDCYNVGAAIAAIKKCTNQCEFDRVVLLTDVDVKINGIEVIQIPSIKSKPDYSKFVVFELYKYFDTSHCLLVQHDGYIQNGHLWDDEWLKFDVAGALWTYNDGRDCANGGFSLRSHRLQSIIAKDQNIEIYSPEDEIIGRLYRHYLEKRYGIVYAPDEVCEQFSFELREPTNFTFGSHGNFYEPYRDHVVIVRKDSMGDLIMASPLMDYYNDRGFTIVLDTRIEYMSLFFNSTYRIKHISEMNPKIKPYKVINLEMAYESMPKEPVLKSYYAMAGITDGEMRNSKLNVWQQPHQKMFNRLVLFHLDSTGLSHRDAHNVDWKYVMSYYERLGFTCIQTGKRAKEIYGTYFNAETIPMLMYLIKGAELVVAIDSGVAQIAVALNRPTLIMSGSVNLELRYSDFTNIEVVQSECPSVTDKHCYHNEISTVGVKCKYNEETPPCASYDHYKIIASANKLLNKTQWQ